MLRFFRSLLLPLLIAAGCTSARADNWFVKDANNGTVALCGKTVNGIVIPCHVLRDENNNPVGTLANPLAFTYGTGATLPPFGTTPTFNLGSLNGAATATKQDAGNTSLDAIKLLLGLAPAQDATLTNGLAKFVNRGGGKGTTTAADVTSTICGANHQCLDVVFLDPATGLPAKIGIDPGANTVKVDSTVPVGTQPVAGENHLGEVGGHSAVVPASFTRPATTPTYAVGGLVANSGTAASVTPMTFIGACRKIGGTGRATAARLSKTSTSLTNASYRLHLYKVAPTTVTNGDGGAWLTNEATWIGSFDVTMDKVFTDAAKGKGNATVGAYITYECATGSTSIYGLLEARAAYVGVSAEAFTAALETDQD